MLAGPTSIDHTHTSQRPVKGIGLVTVTAMAGLLVAPDRRPGRQGCDSSFHFEAGARATMYSIRSRCEYCAHLVAVWGVSPN